MGRTTTDRVLTWVALLSLSAPVLSHATAALADPNPWGNGGGSPGYRQQGSGPLAFPAQGVICDSSVAVCFNASGAAIADTEREFGRRARVRLERNLINNPVIDVTFADGRYCNFSLRGCWTNRQRTMVDQQLNPWLFGGTPGSPGGQGTVIGGAGSSWGPGSGMNPALPSGSTDQPPFTRTRQSGTCTWMNAGISIYNGNCRYEILQNNVDGSSSLSFTFDRLPMANPLRTIRFTATGNGPWSIRMPNGSTSAVQSRITPDPYRTRIMLAWGNVFDLRFRSSEQATTARLNQAMQPVDAYGQPVQGSEAEALGEALGGLLKRLFGGN